MNYKKICTSEAIALIVVVMINQVLLGSAKEIITDTASSAWIHTILISAIALLFTFLICKLFSKFTNLDIIDISEFLAGKVLKYIVCIGLIGFFILSASLILNHIANSLSIIYLTNLNVLFLMLIFLIGAVIVSMKDIGVIARTNLIILTILLIPMVILFVSIASDMQINNLFPILGYGINDTFFNNTTNVYAFSGIIYLFLITPLLKDSNEHQRIGIISIIISSLYLFFTVTSLLMSFPFASVTDDLLSIYLLSRLVSFGTFLERVDVIYVFLWILSSFSYLSILFYFLTSTFQKMTKLKNRNGILYSLATIVLGTTILMKDIADLRFAHRTISMYYFLGLFAVLFIILILAYFKKRKRERIQKL